MYTYNYTPDSTGKQLHVKFVVIKILQHSMIYRFFYLRLRLLIEFICKIVHSKYRPTATGLVSVVVKNPVSK